MRYEDTSGVCAGIYTKTFDDVAKWTHACDLINIALPSRLPDLYKAYEVYWNKPPRSNKAGLSS
eukprot:7649877-Alexandrium_andersonii.AAC.1